MVIRLGQSKIYWLYFHVHFSSGQNEIECGDEVVQGKQAKTTFEEHYWNKGNNCWFTDCIQIGNVVCIRTLMNEFDSNLVWW